MAGGHRCNTPAGTNGGMHTTGVHGVNPTRESHVRRARQHRSAARSIEHPLRRPPRPTYGATLEPLPHTGKSTSARPNASNNKTNKK
jgi:hypothetical protein